MKDPTKFVRQMYKTAFEDNSICLCYDGIAPADATGLYAVIVSTTWKRLPVKSANHIQFTSTIDIYQEFRNDGNSEGVDNACDELMEILMPLSSGYLAISGYDITETTTDSMSNDSGVNDAVLTFRKTIVLNHLITENR
jgi:hypothetical protein